MLRFISSLPGILMTFGLNLVDDKYTTHVGFLLLGDFTV